MRLNTLTIKTLQCDELHFQLITLIITTSRNVKIFGQKRQKWRDVMSCKINSSRLIKLTFNELNRIVTSDEFLTKLF